MSVTGDSGVPGRLLVVSDLDGTLLDHHTYSWAPARPALERLRRAGIPLIPATSKTLAEVAHLIPELDLAPGAAVVAENGAVIGWPRGGGAVLEPEVTGPDYAAIRGALARARAEGRYRFRGFADMTDREVAAATGLTLAGAERARRRLGSEPLLWEDAPERVETLRERLTAAGLQLVAGGRFLHVLGDLDKAGAVARVAAALAAPGGVRPRILALGDGPNDAAMLQAADVAVVVRNPAATPPRLPGHPRVLYTAEAGPAGWARAVAGLLDEYLGPEERERG